MADLLAILTELRQLAGYVARQTNPLTGAPQAPIAVEPVVPIPPSQGKLGG